MNIVTIDFDIVMHRSLGIYNDLVDDEENTVQDILNNNPESGFYPIPDLSLYNYLTNYVAKVAKKLPKNKIIFIDSHEAVANIIDADILNIGDKEFNIFNLDFHHDIAYDEDDKDNRLEEYDCGNWVKYLFDHYQNFKEYIWIKTKESTDYDGKNNFVYKTRNYDITKYNLDALVKSTDVLFLCKSEPWVPLEVNFLYELWKDLFA